LEMGLFCPGWPWTLILPISASQVAGITGMSPECLAALLFLRLSLR
jgi:hypothetical protein